MTWIGSFANSSLGVVDWARSVLWTLPPLLAQWSIGAPGLRQPASGNHRYVYVVFSNPLPGREVEFNNWYLNIHLGDLVQLDGFTGVQRFRLEVVPQLSARGYEYSYLALWDMEDTDIAPLRARMKAAIDGGKSRLGAGFNYNPGGWADATYETVGPRVTRPDGQRGFMPDARDNKSHRPNRYAFLEFCDPAPAIPDTTFAAALDRRIEAVLTISGWMAAQRFIHLPLSQLAIEGHASTRAEPRPRFLILWEVEAPSARAAKDLLQHATSSGQVTALNMDETTWQASFWEPISPYVTKDAFMR